MPKFIITAIILMLSSLPIVAQQKATDGTKEKTETSAKKDKKDKNPWYSGSAKVDVPTIKLKKK